MRTAIGYLRTNDGDGQKLRQQRAQIQQWAASTGHTILSYHADDCIDGKTDPKRCPGLQAAIAAVAPGGSVLAVASLDRISRSPAHVAAVAQRVQRFRGNIEAADLPAGTTTGLLSLSAHLGEA